MRTIRIRTLLMAATLALTIVPWASAQTTDESAVMFHWGALHRGADQAIVINFELTDHFGDSLTLPVELQLEDRNGKVIYQNAVTMSDGHAISFVVASEGRTLRSAIDADIYAIIGPEYRFLAPCIKVIFPPGPGVSIDRMTVTLEVMDVVTGRVVSVANNPHSIIGVLKQ